MFIQFDRNRLHLQIICGTLESYKPSKEMRALQKKLNKLLAKTSKFQEEVLTPALEEIEKGVEEINAKHQEKAKVEAEDTEDKKTEE